MTTFEKVQEILVDKLGVDTNEIKLESSIQDDLGADSLSVMEIVMSVEEEFGITVPEEDLTSIQTVQDIVSKVDNA